MTRLRKLLIYILLACTLGYGSAWAYETHAVEVEDRGPVTTYIDDQSVDQHISDSDVCDHCCHVFGHILGICTQSTHIFSSNKTSEPLEFSQNFISLILSPDLRPPRA